MLHAAMLLNLVGLTDKIPKTRPLPMLSSLLYHDIDITLAIG
jgi:hypothetical protein